MPSSMTIVKIGATHHLVLDGEAVGTIDPHHVDAVRKALALEPRPTLPGRPERTPPEPPESPQRPSQGWEAISITNRPPSQDAKNMPPAAAPGHMRGPVFTGWRARVMEVLYGLDTAVTTSELETLLKPLGQRQVRAADACRWLVRLGYADYLGRSPTRSFTWRITPKGKLAWERHLREGR